MEEEVIFRGEVLLSDELVYGDLIHDRYDLVFIQYIENNVRRKVRVKNETVGQYTGLTSKSSKKVFTGDIVFDSTKECYGKVKRVSSEFFIAWDKENEDSIELHKYMDSKEICVVD